jgi:hypothetical protein
VACFLQRGLEREPGENLSTLVAKELPGNDFVLPANDLSSKSGSKIHKNLYVEINEP